MKKPLIISLSALLICIVTTIIVANIDAKEKIINADGDKILYTSKSDYKKIYREYKEDIGLIAENLDANNALFTTFIGNYTIDDPLNVKIYPPNDTSTILWYGMTQYDDIKQSLDNLANKAKLTHIYLIFDYQTGIYSYCFTRKSEFDSDVMGILYSVNGNYHSKIDDKVFFYYRPITNPTFLQTVHNLASFNRTSTYGHFDYSE